MVERLREELTRPHGERRRQHHQQQQQHHHHHGKQHQKARQHRRRGRGPKLNATSEAQPQEQLEAELERSKHAGKPE